MLSSDFLSWLDQPKRRPLLMGVLNITPDSFSDGGLFGDSRSALSHAKRMIDEGADLIDIGGESTRPGSQRVFDAEQIRRVIPAIQAIAQLGIAVSIDTTRSAVAIAALDAGASIINDISAGTEDPDMLTVAANRRIPIILMHMQGEPCSMQFNPTYNHVTQDVLAFLMQRAHLAQQSGIPKNRILIDPGIGFGKTVEHNLQLLRDLSLFSDSGYPVILGTSRKSFIGKITDEPDPSSRQFGTAATIAWGLTNHMDILRVHDVKAMHQVMRMMQAIIDPDAIKAR